MSVILVEDLQSKKEVLSIRLLKCFILFYVCGCLASMYICAPHACLVPVQSTRGLQIWNWSY